MNQTGRNQRSGVALRRIGILGHVGTTNLGDEAIIAAVIQNIKWRLPNAQIFGFTRSPFDTSERHNIPAFPIRRIEPACKDNIGRGTTSQSDFTKERGQALRDAIKARLKIVSPRIYGLLKAITKAVAVVAEVLCEVRFLVISFLHLRKIDLLIIAGSGQLTDYFGGGAWGFPYTLWKWSILSKLRGTRIAFLSVGAGPISSRLGRFFTKCSLSLASYRSFRDATSRDLVESLGVLGRNPVFPDLVYSLRMNGYPSTSSESRARRVVGINPLPYFDGRYWPQESRQVYEEYLQCLALFALWLTQRGYKVLFFPTQLRSDPLVIGDITAIMKKHSSATSLDSLILDTPVRTFEDLVSQLARTDIVVATRFHGILISYLMKRPVLGISYHHKTHDLMRRMGQEEYCLDIRGLPATTLMERFEKLEFNSENIKRKIEYNLLEHVQAVHEQYDILLGVTNRVD